MEHGDCRWRVLGVQRRMIITRRLNPGEGRLYRAVRLEALRESPGAFLSRYEDAVGRSDESWAEQADGGATGSDRATFVTIVDRPVGVVSLYRDEDEPEVGELLQMWVAPEVRGGTVAADLLMAVLGWAEGNGFGVVKAEVMKTNVRAFRFYEKFGFLLCSGDYAACGLQLLRPVGGAGGGEALPGDGVGHESSTRELR
jgi:RimJ/RimL family protein N-acetyltransferase